MSLITDHMDAIVLSLGSNIGDRIENFATAQNLLEERGLKISQASSYFESEPVGFTDQDQFLNQVIVVETDMTPQELLATCLAVEEKMGRVRVVKNGPRLIDIDLLFYRDEILSEETLLLPHPRIGDRRFVLEPLAEILPDALHPVMNESITEMLHNCEDDHAVEPYDL